MTLESFFSLTPQQPLVKRLPVDDGPAVTAGIPVREKRFKATVGA